MAMTLAANDDHEADESSTLMLPTLEDQQRENKAWQDVFDTPATKQAESADLYISVRKAAVGLAGRIESVEKLKEEAKTSFKDSKYGLALRSYCMCIWLLRLDDPPVPKLLLDPKDPSGEALVRLLEETASKWSESAPAPPAADHNGTANGAAHAGDGEVGESGVAYASSPGAASGSDELDAMVNTLRLNVAACTLKLEDWTTARKACELVLASEPAHAKALYRLAQALDGAGEVKQAMSVLSGQLLRDPSTTTSSSSSSSSTTNTISSSSSASYPIDAGGESAQVLREGRRLLSDLRKRSEAERRMFGGLFERAQGGGTADDGIYSDNALEAEARRRREEKEKLATIGNLAKLPPDMWADTFGELRPETLNKMIPENKELAQQMPDGGWAKAASMMTPEHIENAKAAVELHKAREALKKEGLLPEEDELEGEEEDADGWEAWFDRMLTKFGLVVGAVVALTAVVAYVSPGALGVGLLMGGGAQ